MAKLEKTHGPVLPLEQGHLARLQDGLDFVNTLDFSPDPHDHLDSPRAVLEWLCNHDLLHVEAKEDLLRHYDASPEAGGRVLARLLRAREAMRGILEKTAGRRAPNPADLAELNRALRTHYVYELVLAPDGVRIEHRHQGDPVEGAIARLVESIARELTQGHPERVRICQNEKCRWVFADTSRTGRRKWCEMSTCGNRAKVARYRARQRIAASPTGP